MKALLKFLSIFVVGTVVVVGGMFWYVEYIQTEGAPQWLAKRAEPAPESAPRRGTFGPYAFDYAVIDGAAVATFTPMQGGRWRGLRRGHLAVASGP